MVTGDMDGEHFCARAATERARGAKSWRGTERTESGSFRTRPAVAALENGMFNSRR